MSQGSQNYDHVHAQTYICVRRVHVAMMDAIQKRKSNANDNN